MSSAEIDNICNATGTKEGSRDVNPGEDKSAGFDLYSFWNTFDPNEISPEPPPNSAIMATVASDRKDTTTHLHPHFSSSHQPKFDAPNNAPHNLQIQNTSSHRNEFEKLVSTKYSQNELHKMSSAIAASKMSSSVIRQSNSFNNGIAQQRLHHQFIPHKQYSGLANSSPIEGNQIHVPSYSSNFSSKFQNHIHDETQSMTSLQHSLSFDGVHGYDNQSVYHNYNKERLLQQKEHSTSIHREKTGDLNIAAYRSIQNPTVASKPQNYSQQINRYPLPLNEPTSNQPFYHSHGNRSRLDSAPYINNACSPTYSNSHLTKQYLTPNSIYGHHPNSHNFSTPQAAYNGNIYPNLSSAAYEQGRHSHIYHQKPSNSGFVAPNYSSGHWPSPNPFVHNTSPSITAASNDLISNSIIYKKSSNSEGPKNSIDHQLSQNYTQFNPSEHYKNPAKSIAKPWDYIPKYNIQRDRNQYESLSLRQKNEQNRASITEVVQSETKLHHKYAMQQSYQPNTSKADDSTTKLDPNLIPSRSQSIPKANGSGEYDQVYSPHKSCPIQTQPYTDPSNYSTMNDLIQITEKVLNNEIDFGNTVRNRNTDHRQTYLTSNTSFHLKTSQNTHSKPRKNQQSVAKGLQTLCYNCGAFVGSDTSVADEVTTIAICHNCKEVLYFVTDENTAKNKSLKIQSNTHKETQKINHSSNTTTSSRSTDRYDLHTFI